MGEDKKLKKLLLIPETYGHGDPVFEYCPTCQENTQINCIKPYLSKNQLLVDLNGEIEKCRKEQEKHLLQGNTKKSFYWAGRKEQNEELAKKWGLDLG